MRGQLAGASQDLLAVIYYVPCLVNKECQLSPSLPSRVLPFGNSGKTCPYSELVPRLEAQ